MTPEQRALIDTALVVSREDYFAGYRLDLEYHLWYHLMMYRAGGRADRIHRPRLKRLDYAQRATVTLSVPGGCWFVYDVKTENPQPIELYDFLELFEAWVMHSAGDLAMDLEAHHENDPPKAGVEKPKPESR